MTPILPTRGPRRSYRPPTGIPHSSGGREDWRLGSAVSVLVHLGVLVLLIAPFAVGVQQILETPQGAGGPGPAGGGGGGVAAEVLRYVQVAAAPKPPAPIIDEQPVPQLPVIPPPTLVTERLSDPAMLSVPAAAPSLGTTGGAGSGPGSGGGVGSGIGTGAGAGLGPGTGGGTQANYPPTPIEMFIPPLPVPDAVKGFHLVAEFDVDERGKVLGMTFTPTRDRGYNRRLEEVLSAFRFRPGTRPDGTPIRMKAQVVVDLY